MDTRFSETFYPSVSFEHVNKFLFATNVKLNRSIKIIKIKIDKTKQVLSPL